MALAKILRSTDFALPLFEWRDLITTNILKMNKIQKMIKELEDEKSKAKKNFNKNSKFGYADQRRFEGAYRAFDLCVQKLELLLNTENENSGEKEG